MRVQGNAEWHCYNNGDGKPLRSIFIETLWGFIIIHGENLWRILLLLYCGVYCGYPLAVNRVTYNPKKNWPLTNHFFFSYTECLRADYWKINGY